MNVITRLIHTSLTTWSLHMLGHHVYAMLYTCCKPRFGIVTPEGVWCRKPNKKATTAGMAVAILHHGHSNKIALHQTRPLGRCAGDFSG